jgi:hypothetical protein
MTIEEQIEELTIVDARLVAGQGVDDFYVHGLRGDREDQGIEGLDIVLSSDFSSVKLEGIPGNPGYYRSPAGFLLSPSTSYHFSTNDDGRLLSAHTQCPPNMEDFATSKDEIDASLNGDLVFLEWSGVNTGSVNEYFYVIDIHSLSDDPDYINPLEAPTSAQLYSYTPELTLSLADFNFFGPHSIEVHAVSLEHEPLYRPQASPEVNGPSNIMGGYGFFISSTVLEGQVNILR